MENRNYPPIPQLLGSVMLSAAEVATAASANGEVRVYLHEHDYYNLPAFPPFLRISRPASVAKG